MEDRDSQLTQWMQRAQAGDAASYRSLLMEIRPILHRYHARGLLRMGVSDPGRAEDLVQETLLAIHSKRATYDPEYPFGAWMTAIARYKLIDLGRKLKKEAPIGELDVLDALLERSQPHRVGQAAQGSEATQAADAATDLLGLLDALSSDQRQILKLIKLDGRSVAEAAEITGKSQSAIKVTVHRAIKLLRAKVEKSL